MAEISSDVRPTPGWRFESELWNEGFATVAGVDEAGRGAWAGPVVVGVVVLPVAVHPFVDSKTVAAPRRASLAAEVRARALAWAIVEADAGEVDAIGVLNATLAAAERGVRALAGHAIAVAELGRRADPTIDALVTDYLRLPTQRWGDWDGPRGIRHPARADALSYQVAAASLLAKTHRDDVMRAAAVRWPEYGFERHKGYGAPEHRSALARVGPCAWHRRTFRPVAALAPRRGLDRSEESTCQTPSV